LKSELVMAGLRYAELAQELCGRESLRGI